jgi:hypothetical protein
LFIKAAVHVVPAAKKHAWIAAPILIVFGRRTIVRGPCSSKPDQQRVATELRARVGAIRLLRDPDRAAIGAITGRPTTRSTGRTTPL